MRPSLKKLFCLPSPKDLGRSTGNALPSRYFSPETTDYTWEDWEEEVKAKYPIRFFFAETLYNWAYRHWRKVTDLWYKIKCHVLPSYRFHLLDLRRPAPDIDYTYGYVDPCVKLVYAAFAILRSYIEEEKPYNLRTDYSQEEIDAEPALASQQQHYDEAMAIYNWWMVERPLLEKSRDAIATKRTDTMTKQERESWVEEYGEIENTINNSTQEMLIRLIKIRPGLWT